MDEKSAKKRLFDTFVGMLQTMDFGRITVSELCKRSRLNRASFYHHYLDLYDLGEAVIRQWLDELNEIVRVSDYTKGERLYYLNYFTYANEHREMLIAVNRLKQYSEFESIDTISERYETRNIVKDVFGDFDVDYQIAFAAGALNGVEKKWIERGFQETPEELWQIFLSNSVKITKESSI